ncbi:acyl-CoA dehydrogenase family protein [Nocardia jinanensis]|uniref:Acyl-CoA dehydrogenase n=1 Tax=Nocardia jinanensis TaxID=382504 RepID=A0A917RMT0_9NOCA|nr:acyl-CoA dehydrogenase family protein [Nocardia jinanensis]GGL15097.1 acyl-CoA dehydrogenase [Nocardia jinanensis]
MSFTLTEERAELRRTVRGFFEKTSPEETVRRLMDTDSGFDADAWKQMAGQLGLHQLAVPEEFGGAGYTFVELGLALEEAGRALVCMPFFSTIVLAANVVLSSNDEQAKKEILPALAGGETTATLAFTEPSGRWDEAGITMRATGTGTGWTLTGEKTFVLDGHTADLVLVAARTESGISLFAVDGDAPGLTRSPMHTLDPTRKQARLVFADVPARLIGQEGSGGPILAHVLDLAAVALATEAVGGAQRCLDMAVEYAKTRVQFGRPIGSFQAIKHKCADLVLEVESARSAAYHALWAAAEDDTQLPVAAAMAKSYCTEAFTQAAADNIQIHGGIGFTWEHPAHLYFRRAKSTELLLGDPAYHRELLVQRLGL